MCQSCSCLGDGRWLTNSKQRHPLLDIGSFAATNSSAEVSVQGARRHFAVRRSQHFAILCAIEVSSRDHYSCITNSGPLQSHRRQLWRATSSHYCLRDRGHAQSRECGVHVGSCLCCLWTRHMCPGSRSRDPVRLCRSTKWLRRSRRALS